MQILRTHELERLVRAAFPQKRDFSADKELAVKRAPIVAFVHDGPDPFLDRALDAWLDGCAAFVGAQPLLNRLCSVGALAPGEYALVGSKHS